MRSSALHTFNHVLAILGTFGIIFAVVGNLFVVVALPVDITVDVAVSCLYASSVWEVKTLCQFSVIVLAYVTYSSSFFF